MTTDSEPKFTYRPIPGYVDLFPPSEESLVRSLFENGHATTTMINPAIIPVIEVYRSESGCLLVDCYNHAGGYVYQMPAIPGAVWCCDWSRAMFERYFGAIGD